MPERKSETTYPGFGQGSCRYEEKFAVEDHHDDCREDLSSLVDTTREEGMGEDWLQDVPRLSSASEDESDQAHDEDLVTILGDTRLSQ